MKQKTNLFLRFSGKLWENMIFEREPGWETENIADRPIEEDSDYRLNLLDEDGRILVSASPLVDFHNICLATDNEMRLTRVIAYIPFREDGRELIFLHGEQTLHREKVAKEPPKIQIEEVTPQNGSKIAIKWSAEHPEGQSLSFNVIYTLDNGRAFLIAKGLQRRSYTADLSKYPGSKEGRLAVLATDGARSAFAVSESFSVEEKNPEIWIQHPNPDETFPADHPISLNGQALDVAGASLSEEELIWQVDDKEIERGKRLALAPPLVPGRHEVTLQFAPDGQVITEQTVTIYVAKRSPEQESFWEIVQSLPDGESEE